MGRSSEALSSWYLLFVITLRREQPVLLQARWMLHVVLRDGDCERPPDDALVRARSLSMVILIS